MIGLDTNVLVRYLVQDDPAQSRKATQVIAKQCTRDDPGFINRIVLRLASNRES
jgi:predicted nucleic-acid-binding protein